MRERDEFDRILDPLKALIDEWDEKVGELADAEPRFKQWFALQKKAHMDAGASATKAETEVMATQEWADYYGRIRQLEREIGTLVKRQQHGDRHFEAERTRQANLRRIA